MKLISHADILALHIQPQEFAAWARDVLMHKQACVLPPKISLHQPGHIFFNTMPVILPWKDVFGVKVVSRFPNREPALDSQIFLYGLQDGGIKAILDGNYITAMRTGAVAAQSVCLFAKSDTRTIGLIGLGNTARAFLQVLFRTHRFGPLHIKLYAYKDQAPPFIAAFAGEAGVTFSVHDTYAQVIEDSDVVVSCVTFQEGDFCSADAYKPGCLVVPVHTLGFQNCDMAFDKVFADDRGHVQGFRYFSQFRSFGEVSDVLGGRIPGRSNDRERILVYNIGIAAHDVYCAEQVYQRIGAQETAQIQWNKPMEKYYL